MTTNPNARIVVYRRDLESAIRRLEHAITRQRALDLESLVYARIEGALAILRCALEIAKEYEEHDDAQTK